MQIKFTENVSIAIYVNLGYVYILQVPQTIKVKREKCFPVHWISSIWKENFHGYCFISIWKVLKKTNVLC